MALTLSFSVFFVVVVLPSILVDAVDARKRASKTAFQYEATVSGIWSRLPFPLHVDAYGCVPPCTMVKPTERATSEGSSVPSPTIPQSNTPTRRSRFHSYETFPYKIGEWMGNLRELLSVSRALRCAGSFLSAGLQRAASNGFVRRTFQVAVLAASAFCVIFAAYRRIFYVISVTFLA